ncbi:MAG TPA: hypothetical protein PK006_11660 [Saprospiraceae bacterium]|nr:hypothetical protein [Saprospiraceae bacterium]
MSKSILFSICIVLFSLMPQDQISPVYVLFFGSVIASFFLMKNSLAAFAITMSVGFMSWLLFCLYLDGGVQSRLSVMIGEVFQSVSAMQLKYLTAFIGGMTAALGASLGSSIRVLMRK